MPQCKRNHRSNISGTPGNLFQSKDVTSVRACRMGRPARLLSAAHAYLGIEPLQSATQVPAHVPFEHETKPCAHRAAWRVANAFRPDGLPNLTSTAGGKSHDCTRRLTRMRNGERRPPRSYSIWAGRLWNECGVIQPLEATAGTHSISDRRPPMCGPVFVALGFSPADVDFSSPFNSSGNPA